MNEDDRERDGCFGLVAGHVHDGPVLLRVPLLVVPEGPQHRVEGLARGLLLGVEVADRPTIDGVADVIGDPPQRGPLVLAHGLRNRYGLDGEDGVSEARS